MGRKAHLCSNFFLNYNVNWRKISCLYFHFWEKLDFDPIFRHFVQIRLYNFQDLDPSFVLIMLDDGGNAPLPQNVGKCPLPQILFGKSWIFFERKINFCWTHPSNSELKKKYKYKFPFFFISICKGNPKEMICIKKNICNFLYKFNIFNIVFENVNL